MTEIRWHARAGQGAKTASQLVALALLRSGRYVQAFPEYGPERRGAPMRAYTRVGDTPIRRHDAVTRPDIAVVLDPSLLHDVDVTEGLAPDGLVLVAGDECPAELEAARVRCVHVHESVNVTMAGAVGALLGVREEQVERAAADVLGPKVEPESLRTAVREGYACLT